MCSKRQGSISSTSIVRGPRGGLERCPEREAEREAQGELQAEAQKVLFLKKKVRPTKFYLPPERPRRGKAWRSNVSVFKVLGAEFGCLGF